MNLTLKPGVSARYRCFARVLLLLLLSLFAPHGGAQQVQDDDQSLTTQRGGGPRFKGWFQHAHDVQHTSVSSVRSQPVRHIEWETPVDLRPQLSFGELLIHYGSPLVTPKNTVIVPVKIGATDGFRVEARDGHDGFEI